MQSPWIRIIGILGGMGPHAHLDMERALLAAVDAEKDQDYPPWVLVSLPEVPDRTEYLLADGPSPVDKVVEGVERLEAAGADFVMIVCNTAHAVLDEVRRRTRLPIMHLLEETLLHARRNGWKRLGLLATTGTTRTGLYAQAAERIFPESQVITLLDSSDGEALQEEAVARAIYGPLTADDRRSGGIKAGFDRDPLSGESYADMLRRPLTHLIDRSVDAVILGCTELPLALGREPIDGTPLLDPVEIVAREAVRIARGERDLSSFA